MKISNQNIEKLSQEKKELSQEKDELIEKVKMMEAALSKF